MDVNGTRFHLLLTEDDWSRVSGSDKVHWNSERNELTLQPTLFRFVSAAKDRLPSFSDRRGAARDRFGNWFWIAEDESEIVAFSSGSRTTSHFWPNGDGAGSAGNEEAGDFRPLASTGGATSLRLRGLAVTEDHYLIVGTLDPGGLLIFDLHSGGPPTRQIWPVSAAFAPFDMSPMPGGGVWILDRPESGGPARYWAVDRFWNVISRSQSQITVSPGTKETFRAATEPEPRLEAPIVFPSGISLDASIDAIAIEALPDGTVLILDRNGQQDFSRIYRFDLGTQRGEPVSLEDIKDLIESSKRETFKLIAHDFAFVTGRIYVVGTDGNQSYGFHAKAEGDQLTMEPIEEFLPMRLFGGKGVVGAGDRPYYDFGDIWVPLVEQRRPRYESEATFYTPVLDGKEPQCVWHRLLMDACIPSDTAVVIRSRAADKEGDIEFTSWNDEPSLYLRSSGSELPFVTSTMTAEGSGTWEFLFQHPRGRFMQLEITMIGSGRTTPHLRALRVYYPRFSYLEEYLPSVYREDNESASFVERFLGNFEGMYTSLEDKIATVQMLFDVRSVQADALDWLASWFGIALDPVWDERRRRLFIRHAMDFFRYRGTIHGLQTALSLALGESADEKLFRPPSAQSGLSNPIRIVEKFRTRRTPGIVFGDPAAVSSGPRSVTTEDSWNPTRGAEELSRLYRKSLKLDSSVVFPLIAPEGTGGTAAEWEVFSSSTLGFTPAAASPERSRWSQYLQGRYLEMEKLNAAYDTSWSGFEQVPFPTDIPSDDPTLTDWLEFAEKDLAASNVTRKRWQAFLSRRYRTVARLNAAYLTQWSSFDIVPIPDALPHDGAPLLDWYQFESVVLPMHDSAHRFTVMLPVAKADRLNRQKQLDQLNLAYRIVNIEKPAHTVCDVRFYWAMFRVGDIRLGDGIPIDAGSRAPELLPPMVLGSGYLAESYLAPGIPENAMDRRILGRDALRKMRPLIQEKRR